MKLSYCLLILTVSADLSIGFMLENVASNRTVAFESFNASLHTVSPALLSSPAHHDLIAKEGTSILIECKLNISQYEYILWYNSRGHLLEQKDEGELSCCFLSFGIPLLHSVWKPLELHYHFLFLPSYCHSWEIRREQDKAHVNYTWILLSWPIHPIVVPCRIIPFKRHHSIQYRRNESASYEIVTDIFICYCSGLYYIFPNTWLKDNSPQLVTFSSW